MAFLTANLGFGAEVIPSVALYLNDKKGAFSFTFDDGFRHQVENTLEILDPLGIKGTFFLIPYYIEDSERSWNMATWPRVKKIEAKGHEIGTHGSIQIKLHEASEAVLEEQINGSWDLLRQKGGLRSVSYAAPGGSRINDLVEAKIREHHYFIRNEQFLPRARIMGYGRTEFREWDDLNMREIIKAAMAAGEWVIPYVHAIVEGYSPFKSKAEFRIHCEWLKSIEGELWIAPMGTVGRYVLERDAAALTVIEQTVHSLTMRLSHSLADKEIFNVPLTVVIPVTGVVKASVVQKGNPEAKVNVCADKILLNILPNGAKVMVEWE